MPDSGAITEALITKLRSDGPLTALMPDGVYRNEAPANSTRFVVVSLVIGHDEPMFNGRAFEDVRYQVKAVEKGTSGTNARAAAARIDVLLDQGTLTIPGYSLMTLRRLEPVEQTEVDALDLSIRWQYRGGDYQLVASL